MARPRKPTAVLELTGAIDRNKKRHAGRASEPKPVEELGSAPSHLEKDEQKVWRQIRTAGFWITSADALTVEALSILVAKMRRREFKSSDFATLRTLCGALGLTPSDRAKIQMPAKEEKDPFADFMASMGADDEARTQ